MLHGVDDMVRLGEVNLVIVPDDLPLALGLQAHFDDISGFVVKQPVRVPEPRDCSEKDDRLLHGVRDDKLVVLTDFLVLGLLAWGVGMVSVHIVGIIRRRHLDDQ